MSFSTNDIDTTIVPGAENSNQNAVTVIDINDEDNTDSTESDTTIYNVPRISPTAATVVDLHGMLQLEVLCAS